MAEPNLNADDIQGNILPGFRRRHQLLVGYNAGSEGVLRQALGAISPHVTAMPPVVRHRDGRKEALLANVAEPEIPDLWVNLALGAAALDRLGEQDVRLLDTAFRIGMRPMRTGDPWKDKDAAGVPVPWCPANWTVGKPSEPLDLLVTFAFDDWALAGGDALLAAIASTGIREIYREAGIRLPGDAEHFGFADGIAEIGVRGTIEMDGEVRPVTTRYGVPPRNGVEFGKPGQPLAWPGQFLVGNATGAGQIDPAPPRYRNGSFLVFRRLSQDVEAFDRDTDEIAQSLDLPAKDVRASIVGRWPSGAALMRHMSEPEAADAALVNNYFEFGSASPDLALAEGPVVGAAADPAPILGLTCPAFAHIRKVNPRDLATDLGGAGETQGFQMLRRGIPFGPTYDRSDPTNPANKEERGLLFLAYQRNPELQFEKLNTNWMNTDDGPGPGGFDLLVGQKVSRETGSYEAKDAIRYITSTEPGHPVRAPRNWVRPSGGAYLFAPSISHIAMLAAGTTPSADRADTIRLETQPDTFSVEIENLGIDLSPGATLTIPRYDGNVLIGRVGGLDKLLEADWPEAALLGSAANALKGASLQALDLSGEHFPTETLSDEDAAMLAGQRTLVRLKLDGTALDGTSLVQLAASLPSLSILNIAGVDLDDADIATLLEKHEWLTDLSLGSARSRPGHRFAAPRLTGAVVAHLRQAPHLRKLSVRDVGLDDTQITGTDCWDRLVEADFSGTRIGDIGAARLATSKSLDTLAIAGTAVGDKGAKPLLKRPWRALDLSWTKISQKALLGMRHPETLSRLSLAGLELDDGIAALVARARGLDTLDLSNNAIGHETAAAIGKSARLRELDLRGTALKSGGAVLLAGAPVETLAIDFIPDTSDMKALAGSASLRQLTMRIGSDWTGLSTLQADTILSARAPSAGSPPPRLKTLWLSGSLEKELANDLSKLGELRALSADSIMSVSFSRGFSALQDLHAANAGIDDRCLAELLALPSIRALYISDNPFGSAFGGPINPQIHTLELRNTQVDDDTITALANLPRLHCIDVPGTRITAEGVARLASEALNLQSLALDGRQIEKPSIAALAAAPRLVELYLYGETVTNETLAALTSLRLRELVLIGTSVDDMAVPYLAGISGLRSLTLGGELSQSALATLRALRPHLHIRE